MGEAGGVSVRETHSAVVFFVGDRVFKLKKALNLGFLDFTTRRVREQACRREVALNRRMAPDVYLGVADVLGPDDPRPCDHLVVMRRMPDNRRLSTLVARGSPVRDDLRAIARMLAAFHVAARSDDEVAAAGTRDAVRARWADNLDQTRQLRGHGLDARVTAEVERLALRYLGGREPLFTSRIHRRLIRDGHGDLLADDIFCLPDGPRVLDCLEFLDEFRYVDGLDDAAFLAMDLERLGAPELAAGFIAWYVEFSGAPSAISLEHHYIAYRAFVRAKVASLRAQQGDRNAMAEANRLTHQAHAHLSAGAVRLILIGGLPATGKSTLAGGLADALGATLVSSDRVRKELTGLDPTTPAPAAYQHGIYTPASSDRVYAAMLGRAKNLLGMGETVILDASWTDATHRAHAAALAEETRSDLIQLRCEAPHTIAHQRIAQRRSTRGTVSDADTAIATRMAIDADPWPEATPIDTNRPPGDGVRDALLLIHPPQTTPHWPRPRMLPD
ncbi:MAG: AAA family ATPase [Carbonactinosporaceae bacterium]